MAGRTREFGVRRALGANASSITRLVLGYGMRLTVIGGAAGMILGLGALRLMAGMLFGSWSVVALGAGVGLVLGGVTLVACALPAMRATRTSPASALRLE
jgi:ABC-type antimicrobial peptide transport system permease subunit